MFYCPGAQFPRKPGPKLDKHKQPIRILLREQAQIAISAVQDRLGNRPAA